MPDALNKVFCVNNLLEDIGGLVDPEDLPDEEGSGSDAGQDISNSTQAGNHEMDLNYARQDRLCHSYKDDICNILLKCDL